MTLTTMVMEAVVDRPALIGDMKSGKTISPTCVRGDKGIVPEATNPPATTWPLSVCR